MEDRQAIEYCKKRYRRVKGFDLNLDDPKHFTEKIQWKKFNDRNPLYTATSDKFMVYEYLRGIGSEVMPPELLDVSDKPIFPKGKWIAKANHGSGWNASYKDTNLEQKFKTWLSSKYVPEAGEWGYKDIQPKIIFQEYLENITEFKFFVFSGRCEMVQHLTYGDKPKITNYDRDFNRLDVFWVYPQGETIPKPEQYEFMLKSAEFLGIFPFARIDFMVSDKVYLSEITHYPTSGFQNIKPLSFDLELGTKWKIK